MKRFWPLSRASRRLKTKEAENAYRKAVEIDREFVHALLNLGVLLYKEKRYIEAEVAYQETLKYEPDNLLVLYNLGTLYDITNRNDLAIRYYKQVLNLAPADCFLREMTNKKLKKNPIERVKRIH